MRLQLIQKGQAETHAVLCYATAGSYNLWHYQPKSLDNPQHLSPEISLLSGIHPPFQDPFSSQNLHLLFSPSPPPLNVLTNLHAVAQVISFLTSSFMSHLFITWRFQDAALLFSAGVIQTYAYLPLTAAIK